MRTAGPQPGALAFRAQCAPLGQRPDKMPEDMPDRTPEDMPNRMPEDMSDRMPAGLPVTKRIHVMVGMTRSKVIVFTKVGYWYIGPSKHGYRHRGKRIPNCERCQANQLRQ